jgi:hypothetical protein
MKIVTLEVAASEDLTRRAPKHFRGKKQRARISFTTPGLLWKALTTKQWEILKAMVDDRRTRVTALRPRRNALLLWSEGVAAVPARTNAGESGISYSR